MTPSGAIRGRSVSCNSGGFTVMNDDLSKHRGSVSAGQVHGGRGTPHARWAVAGLIACASLLGVDQPARAGRGGSPQAIASAISSGSAEAIKSELERAEYLVCAACVPYVLPLIDSEDASIREVAAWWLARRGTSRQVFSDMLTRLSQPDAVKARNAADVLGQFARPQAIPALGAALSNPLFDAPSRAAMARALGAIRRPEAAAPLQAAFGDAAPLVRAAALSAIRKVEGVQAGGQQGANVGSMAIPLLADSDDGVRIEAIFTVAELRTAASAPALVSLLQTDASAGVRKRAAWALGEIHAPASVAGAALSEAARADASPLVRSLAAAALRNLGR